LKAQSSSPVSDHGKAGFWRGLELLHFAHWRHSGALSE
jgi:hypothetical protein